MSGEKLYELVRCWPTEALPSNLRYPATGWAFSDDHRIHPRIAAALHVASGLEWLAGSKSTDIVPVLNHKAGSKEWWRIEDAVDDEVPGAMDWQPTLIEAVSAAIMAVTKEKP